MQNDYFFIHNEFIRNKGINFTNRMVQGISALRTP